MRRLLGALVLAAGIVLGSSWTTAPAALAVGHAPGAASSINVAGAAVAASGATPRATARPAAPVRVPAPGQGWLTGRRQRLLGVWILIDAVGLLWWYGAAPSRPPKLLGSVGAHRSSVPRPAEEDHSVRGIGRFARVRTGPPTRL